MLYRIKSVFERPIQLQLSTTCYYSMLVIVYLVLLFLILIAFFCMNYGVDKKHFSCVILTNVSFFGSDSEYAIIVLAIGWMLDTIITLIILTLFLIRLCKMKMQSLNNE